MTMDAVMNTIYILSCGTSNDINSLGTCQPDKTRWTV